MMLSKDHVVLVIPVIRDSCSVSDDDDDDSDMNGSYHSYVRSKPAAPRANVTPPFGKRPVPTGVVKTTTPTKTARSPTVAAVSRRAPLSMSEPPPEKSNIVPTLVDSDAEGTDGGDSPGEVRRHTARVVPRLLTTEERLAVFTTGPNLANKRLATTKGSAMRTSDQNIYDLFKHVQTMWNSGKDLKYVAVVEEVARRFLTNNNEYGKHIKNMNAQADEIRANIARSYTLDNARPKDAASFAAPRLHFGSLTRRETKQLIDWNERVVVKMYRLDSIYLSDVNRLIDLVTDVVVGAAMSHLLVLGHSKVVSPHMAFNLDWFPGPVIEVRPNTNVDTPTISIVPDVSAQYVVVERADDDVLALIRAGQLSLPVMRSIAWQILYTLEGAYDVAGYLHGDLHPGNVMVRYLDKEPKSSYLDQDWLYVRSPAHATGPSHAVLPFSQHQNVFVEIIDNGRARAYCPVTPPDATVPDDERVLFGNPAYAVFGIHMDEQSVDRSWDLRRFFAFFARYYDINTMQSVAEVAGVPHARKLAKNLKELVVVGSNMIALVKRFIETDDFLEDVPYGEEAEVVKDALAQLRVPYRDFSEHEAGDDRASTYVPPRKLAILIYDVLVAPFFRQYRSVFHQNVFTILMSMTVAPQTPAHLSSRSAVVNPSLCLGLSLFADMGIAEDVDAVLVGMVHRDWADWRHHVTPEASELIMPITPKTPAKSSTAGFAAMAHDAASVSACTACGRDARGYMVEPGTQQASSQAFCSATCMRIATGGIFSARPF